MANRIFFLLGLAAFAIATAFTFSSPAEKIFGDYSQEELRYFEEVAFRNDRLYRWRKNIGVTSEGSDQALEPVLGQVIREVQPLLGNIRIQESEGGNFIIHYPASVAEYAYRYTLPGPLPLGYTLPEFAGNELTRVDIYIHPLLIPAKREQVLKHEFCHALGLLQHSLTLYSEEGLLGPGSSTGQTRTHPLLSSLDRAAIRLLYDSRLRPDFSRKDFRRKTAR